LNLITFDSLVKAIKKALQKRTLFYCEVYNIRREYSLMQTDHRVGTRSERADNEVRQTSNAVWTWRDVSTNSLCV